MSRTGWLCLAIGIALGLSTAEVLSAFLVSSAAWPRVHTLGTAVALLTVVLVGIAAVGMRRDRTGRNAPQGRTRTADLEECLIAAQRVAAFCADLASQVEASRSRAGATQPRPLDVRPLVESCTRLERRHRALADRGRAIAAIPDTLLAIRRPEIRWVAARAKQRDAEAFVSALRRKMHGR